MIAVLQKFRCLIGIHLWCVKRTLNWSFSECACCGKRGASHFIPVLIKEGQNEVGKRTFEAKGK